ncbi:trypsin-like serine protease [Candidatus Woesearchaeota archaeon]|nr:trypsin-like serine protease [Candidatus Woesearchaeota archaeon]
MARTVTIVISTSLLLLLASQVTLFYLFYEFDKDTTARFSTMLANDQLLEQGIEDLNTHIASTTQQLETAILNTRQDLGEQLISVQQELETSTAAFAQDIAALEQSQAQTKASLQDSIRNLQLSNQDFSGTIQDVLPSVVSVLTDESQGSGVIVDREGLVLTNYHVIEDATMIRVVTVEGDVLGVDVLGFADKRDLAVLHIRGDRRWDALDFADDTFVGQNVIAIGNPGGLGFSVTEGIISSTNRIFDGLHFVQISNPINPGNSGGPLVNIEGDIVGINTLKIEGFEGVGFAIPATDAENILAQAKELI